MTKVFVTGSAGMLGQDLCPILEDEGYEVIESTAETLDITDKEAVYKELAKEKPEIVINCAAYTNVDAAETDEENARKVNALGVENIADACAKIGSILVHISTDYVFDGTKEGVYVPSDKTNPQSVYGKTKLEGELAVQKLCEKYYITRTSWLYGHHGKNFVETMISLKDKPELKVVDDQHGCPTWTVDLANAIVNILKEKPEYGVYHVCGEGVTSWYNFAKEIFKLINADVNLNPCTTEEFPRPAKRPHNSAMDNQKRCRNWKAALKDYINLRNF